MSSRRVRVGKSTLFRERDTVEGDDNSKPYHVLLLKEMTTASCHVLLLTLFKEMTRASCIMYYYC